MGKKELLASMRKLIQSPLDIEYFQAVDRKDMDAVRSIVKQVAESKGYEIYSHVGDVISPTLLHEPNSGGLGEFHVTSDPGAWKDTFGRTNISLCAYPQDKITTKSPSRDELVQWGLDNGLLTLETVRRPDGSVVFELDDETPMVRPTETDLGRKAPFYDRKDPLRGGNQGKHLLNAFLQESGIGAIESKYSPDGHEIVIFDLRFLKSAAPVTRDSGGEEVIPISKRFDKGKTGISW